LLFVSDEPVDVATLAAATGSPIESVAAALANLAADLEARGAGIRLQERAGGWRLYTAPEHFDLLERYILSWDTRRLSAAALETLAIVAYAQPVTRAGVTSVRGVNSDSTISSLVEKGLVREAGVADAPGNPLLYATTQTFLEKFGLASVADLPPLADFAPDEETRALIVERLGGLEEAEVIDTLYGDGLEDAQVAQGGEGAVAVARAEALAGEGAQSNMFAADAVLENAEGGLAGAIYSAFGAVEKIDFDKLEFNFDEE
jgi:segregation and condensation protein B